MPARSARADPTLAKVLRELRVDAARSQEDIAFNAGVTAGTLARIELGQTSPEWATVRRVASALDVGLVELAKLIEAAESE